MRRREEVCEQKIPAVLFLLKRFLSGVDNCNVCSGVRGSSTGLMKKSLVVLRLFVAILIFCVVWPQHNPHSLFGTIFCVVWLFVIRFLGL